MAFSPAVFLSDPTEHTKRSDAEEFDALQSILHEADIRTVFQPIVSLRDGSVMGYEALSRGPKGTIFEFPEKLFRAAEQYGYLWELELLCRTKALLSMKTADLRFNLFLNVNPNIILDPKFRQGFTKEYLKLFSIDPANIIFEITERSAVENPDEFQSVIKNYKDQNYKIAIDDAGAGYSGLNMISDVRPHFLKLDMRLIRGIEADPTKQALVKSMYEFSKSTGTLLIAEGIETESEMKTLIAIGVHYGQGFYIQKPSESLSPVREEVLMLLNEQNEKRNRLSSYSLSELYIGHLCTETLTVNENTTAEQAYELFRRCEGAPGLCVTREENVVGILTGTAFYNKLGGRYGYSLHAKRPIANIMEQDFLEVDYTTPVNLAGKRAMSRQEGHVYDFITVTKEGRYYGIVTIKDLLNKTLEIEINHARHLNPLTGLPGNHSIEMAMSDLVRNPGRYTVLYFDIDNFKAYNDVYGFENGDRVIIGLSQLICHKIGDEGFVGHVGGDDFIAIVDADIAEEKCANIIAAFDQSICQYYRPEDFESGYIIAKNRRGLEEKFPLLSISIAGVNVSGRFYPNVFTLSEEVSGIKKECKQIQGSTIQIR